MLHKRFILRQLTRSGNQAAVFVLCVTLSILTIVAVNGFSESINRSLLRDARALHSGDIILHAHYPFSPALLDAVADLEAEGDARSLRIYDFYSVVRSPEGKKTLLADLKAVGPEYPFYGRVELASGRSLRSVLAPGTAIVEQALLDRLGLDLGDRLHVGEAVLTITDVVTHEPDRPVNFLSFGPRVIIDIADLERLDLLQRGSRVGYYLMLKMDEGANLEQTAEDLRSVAVAGQERVETYRTARSRIKRFFDNFLFFLALIAIFTLLLSGIGIRSALTALLKEKERTIAVIKAVGGTGPFVVGHYLAVVAVLGLIGTVLGLILGFGLQYSLPLFFGNLLPENLHLVISWRAVMEGLVLGILVVALFAFIPLHRLREIKPSAVFRKESAENRRSAPFYLAALTIFLFFVGMVLWQLEDIKIGTYFVLGIVGLIVLTGLATQGILFGVRRLPIRSLALRQALRGLFRPGNATRAVIITLSAALAVVFSIYLVEENLDAAFVRSYPADAPNLFFIDIQPDQVDAFSDALGMTPRYYPVIRSRLVSINGERIDREKERKRRGDNLARPFNLTYRDYLLADEAMRVGDSLFRKDLEGLQVSVLDTVVEMKPMAIGDRIRFNIQGVPVEATVSSIRTRTKESIKPFFYFVFPEDSMLRKAPQTIFTAVRVDRDEIGAVQNRIITRFPNVTAVDVTQTIAAFADIVHRFSLVIRFFTVFSIIAGVLIIISSVLATRFARIQEAVYFKILGAKGRFVLTVFTLENLAIGLISALLALVISQAGSWIISDRVFDIPYRPYPAASLLMVLATVLLVIGVGLSASVSILKQRPVIFLREQTEE
ncbi:MAG: ABC transporter permease [Thermodesulfobacteriota bacterium]